MSELDKAIEMCKVIVECPCSVSDKEVKAIDTILSTIEQLRDKVNKDIREKSKTDSICDLAIKDYLKDNLKEIIGG